MQPSEIIGCEEKGLNCLSEASFYPRHRQLCERGKPQAKIVGGLSFASFSLAAKEKKNSHGKTF